MTITIEMVEKYFNDTEEVLDRRIEAAAKELQKEVKDKNGEITQATLDILIMLLTNGWQTDARSDLVKNDVIVSTGEPITVVEATRQINMFPIKQKISEKMKAQCGKLDIRATPTDTGINIERIMGAFRSIPLGSVPAAAGEPLPPVGAAAPPAAPPAKDAAAPLAEGQPRPSPQVSEKPSHITSLGSKKASSEPQKTPEELDRLAEQVAFASISAPENPIPPSPAPAASIPQPPLPATERPLQDMQNFLSSQLDTEIQNVIDIKIHNKWDEKNTKHVCNILTTKAKQRVAQQKISGITVKQIEGLVGDLERQITEKGTRLAAQIPAAKLEENKRKQEENQRKREQEKNEEAGRKLADQIAKHDAEIRGQAQVARGPEQPESDEEMARRVQAEEVARAAQSLPGGVGMVRLRGNEVPPP